MSESPGGSWAHVVALAGARLDDDVRAALEALGRARWSDQSTGSWRVISRQDQATWEIAQYLGRSAAGEYRYARVQVVATVAPTGELVTWQVSNGSTFLGLTDLSAYGLQRGVLYLLDHDFQEWITDTPLFEPRTQGPWSHVLRFLQRRP